MLTMLSVIQLPALILVIVGAFGVAPKIQENLKKYHDQTSPIIDKMSSVYIETASIYQKLQSTWNLKTKQRKSKLKKTFHSIKRKIKSFISAAFVIVLLFVFISVLMNLIF